MGSVLILTVEAWRIIRQVKFENVRATGRGGGDKMNNEMKKWGWLVIT